MTEVNTRFVEGGEYNDYPLFLFLELIMVVIIQTTV